jgi:hypothetical protein
MSSTALGTDFVASSRELASQLDYHRFRKLWLQSPDAELERGLMAAAYERLAQQAISEGEYFLAHDAAVDGMRLATQENAGIEREPRVPTNRLIVQRVTALARSGALREADRVLNEYLEEHQADSRIRPSALAVIGFAG